MVDLRGGKEEVSKLTGDESVMKEREKKTRVWGHACSTATTYYWPGSKANIGRHG